MTFRRLSNEYKIIRWFFMTLQEDDIKMTLEDEWFKTPSMFMQLRICDRWGSGHEIKLNAVLYFELTQYFVQLVSSKNVRHL